MVVISKKTEYGVMLLTYLANNKKLVSLQLVAKTLKIPYRFLCQLAVEMKNGGVLISREGRNGGYGLALNWINKSLYNLLEVMGENRNVVECLCQGKTCGQSKGCKQRKIWQKLEYTIQAELKKIKLGELVK